MCVSFCHRRKILYFIHQDCSLVECRYADPATHGECNSCCHKWGDLCSLTNSPLPNSGRCCHYNVKFVKGEFEIGLDQVQLLEPSPGQSIADVLEDYYLDGYISSPNGTILLNPDKLLLPDTYGLGSGKPLDTWPASANLPTIAAKSSTWDI